MKKTTRISFIIIIIILSISLIVIQNKTTLLKKVPHNKSSELSSGKYKS